jgi:hypothetical protein
MVKETLHVCSQEKNYSTVESDKKASNVVLTSSLFGASRERGSEIEVQDCC